MTEPQETQSDALPAGRDNHHGARPLAAWLLRAVAIFVLVMAWQRSGADTLSRAGAAANALALVALSVRWSHPAWRRPALTAALLFAVGGFVCLRP